MPQRIHIMNHMNRLTPLVVSLLALGLMTGCVPDKYGFSDEYGKPGSGRGEFLSPTDMDLSPEGDLVISDSGNNRIQIVSPKNGAYKLAFGEYGTSGYKMSGTAGCGVNPLTGDIWVSDMRGNKLVKFSKTGAPLLKIDKKMKLPIDVAVDRQGNIYVLMSKQANIVKFDGFGEYIENIGGTGKTALVFPTSITAREDGLYVTDYGGKRVLKMSFKGELIKEYTKKGDYEDLKGPSNLFIDSKGNLLVLDMGEVPIAILAPDGQLLSKIGEFGNEKGQFLYPRGIVSTANGEILVLDNSRNCILSFKNAPK